MGIGTKESVGLNPMIKAFALHFVQKRQGKLPCRDLMYSVHISPLEE